MSPFRTPRQRLPDHLNQLKKSAVGRGGTRSPLDGTPRALQQVSEESANTGSSDRLSELLPVILRAMVGDRADGAIGERPVLLGQGEILEALSPYHRPRSRFEGLMMRKLVGEGYLKPRGARDKSGLSDAYTLTPKGEKLLELRSSQ